MNILILACILAVSSAGRAPFETPVIGDIRQGLEIIAYTGNKVYLINPHYTNTTVNFYAGKEYCDSNGYSVASTISQEETQVLIEFFRRTNYGGHLWLGLSDLIEENRWIWLDTLSSVGPYTNWAGVQPDGGRGQNCAFFGMENYQWWDDSCDSRHNALCQWILI